MRGVLARLGGHGGDRGGVAVIVAVLLGGGVLLGMTAYVVDVGNLMSEREQLLSGADSAALSVAESCARVGGTCPDTNLATTQADRNAKDGVSDVDTGTPCGWETKGRLPTCPAPNTNLTACMNVPPPVGVSWVEVRTSTKLPDGTTVLPPSFAGAVLPGYHGSTVGACSRVAWGSPSGGLALTFSTCEWDNSTNNGTSFYAPPPSVPPASAEQAITVHQPHSNTCGAGPSGWDASGGFGWLDDPNSTCQVVVAPDGSYGAKPGAPASQPCKTALQDAYDNRTVLVLPVYDGVKGTGQNTTYHISGYAGFVVTGYQLPGFSAKSWLTGATDCGGGGGGKSTTCVLGYFVGPLDLFTGQTPGPGPNLGVTVFKTVG
jgi:hypothetical protein